MLLRATDSLHLIIIPLKINFEKREKANFAIGTWLRGKHTLLGFIMDDLAKESEVIGIDLPGFGAVTDFLKQQNLLGIDAVGLPWVPGWYWNWL